MLIMEKYTHDFDLSTTSIGRLGAESVDVALYPNPAVDVLTLTAGRPIKAIRIYSIVGRLVLELMPRAAITQQEIDVSLLEKGTYLLQIEMKDSISVYRKLIKS
jgi:hypothetical protein